MIRSGVGYRQRKSFDAHGVELLNAAPAATSWRAGAGVADQMRSDTVPFGGEGTKGDSRG